MPSNNEVTQVPCHGCGRSLNFPTGKAKAMMRNQGRIVVFCSRKCGIKFNAQEAERQVARNTHAQSNS